MIIISVIVSGLLFIQLSAGRIETTKGCSLEIIIDPFLWSHISATKYPQRSEVDLKRRVGLLVQEYVDFTNQILKKYSFFKDGSFVQLYVQKIKFLTSDCPPSDEAYCRPAASINDLLEAHSSNNHNDVCLSYVFTFQHLTDSTLGLAWTANADKADEGGVCGRFHQPQPEMEWTSHNTGVLNLAYNRREMEATLAKLAFAHEIGHSLGSPHDYPSGCLGDDIEGHYLMHKSGVRGYLPNNHQFSRCSYHNITFLFAALARQDRNCLDPNVPLSVCGNYIIESWEECDCGRSSEDCNDKCCNPNNNRENPCRLKSRKLCSPTEGPCCSEECEFVEEGICSEETECKRATNCTGKSATCPIALHKPSSTTTCDSGTKICSDGVCSSSICARHNMIECSIKDSNPCQVHCQAPNRPETCRPTSELEALFASPVFRGDGAPCDMKIEEEFALGSCSARAECVGGHPNLQTSSWAVGLGTFLICYTIFMALAIWIYCRYFRKAPSSNNTQELAVKSNNP